MNSQKFDTNYSQGKNQPKRIFEIGLRPSIKLWIEGDSQEPLNLEEFVRAANKAERKAQIYNICKLK